MDEPKDSYDILGLSPGASPEEVKEAYAELAKVWRPNRFPNDDRLRPVAERKMAEIDAAYRELKTYLRSNGRGRSSRSRKNAPKAGNSGGGEREDRVYADPAAAGKRCELCGRPSVPGELRYIIYCPSCGALNYLKSRKDYHRGTCAECRAPFRVPVKLNLTTSRKVAYPVFMAVLLGCVWFFFLSGGGGNSRPGRHTASVSGPQAALSNKVPATMGKLSAPAASAGKEVPLPVAPNPPNAAPSPAATTHPHAVPSPAGPAPSVEAAAGPVPAVPPGDAVRKAPGKKQEQAGAVHPKSVQKESHERYEELIERVLKQKSMASQKGIDDLTVIPFDDSTVEQK